jgi:hypothetical protein
MNQGMGKERKEEGHRGLPKLWVPFVIIVGCFLGFLSYVLAFHNLENQLPPLGLLREQMEITLEFHVILSTVGMALLVALLVVYSRTYLQTRANFILGLVVVLFALLFQAILTNPVYLSFAEPYPTFPNPLRRASLPPGFSSPIADIFMIIAYAVFLYLSLE